MSPLFSRRAEQESLPRENNDVHEEEDNSDVGVVDEEDYNNGDDDVYEEETGGGQYDDDELFQDDVEEEDMTYYRTTAKSKVGHPLLMDGGPARPDTTDMSAVAAAMAINNWRVERKAFRDNKQRLLRKSSGSTASSDIVFTGVLNDRLRTMKEVEDSPLAVGHTFPSKEILLIRTAEEANLSRCSTSSKRSNDHRLHIHGVPDSSLRMFATFTSTKGWKVTRCETRIALPPVNHDGITVDEEVENVAAKSVESGGDKGGEEGGDDLEEGDADGSDADGDLEEGDADGSDADGLVPIKESSKKARKTRTPFKSRWIFPFIKDDMAQTPNISNREMKRLFADYVKKKFMRTISLLQNARSFARDQIFGDPCHNVLFSNALVDKMKEGGHDVVMVLKDRLEVTKMLERVVLSDKMRKNKAKGKLMSKDDKKIM